MDSVHKAGMHKSQMSMFFSFTKIPFIFLFLSLRGGLKKNSKSWLLTNLARPPRPPPPKLALGIFKHFNPFFKF